MTDKPEDQKQEYENEFSNSDVPEEIQEPERHLSATGKDVGKDPHHQFVPVIVSDPAIRKKIGMNFKLLVFCSFMLVILVFTNITMFAVTLGNQSQLYRKAIKLTNALSSEEIEAICMNVAQDAGLAISKEIKGMSEEQSQKTIDKLNEVKQGVSAKTSAKPTQQNRK